MAAAQHPQPGGSRERAPHQAVGHSFIRGLARAAGGAILFTLPLMMTMEMWWLGYFIDPLRLALLLAVFFPLLVGISHVAGFEPTFCLKDDLRDTCIAYAIGFAVPAAGLTLFNVVQPNAPLSEVIGKVAVQAVPASLGALLARSQLGGGTQKNRKDEQDPTDIRYGKELFLMMVGALFLAMNVAPTDEMALLAYRMTPWHSVALVLVSLAVMHAFVYAVELRGTERARPGAHPVGVFLRFTVAGYALVLGVCFYVLWTFGRADGTSAEEMLAMTIVLAFPGSVGAAAARLIL